MLATGGAASELQGPVGLAIAHPGHEIRLSRWVESARPTVLVLTAGSRGGESRDRVQASRVLVDRLGAQAGGVFGRYLDREVYAWVVAGDARPFVGLAEELADSFVRQDLAAVVTDAWQLYDVCHDLWHLTVRASAAMASDRLGRLVECLDYPVVPDPMAARAVGRMRVERLLTEADVDEKLRLAADYPDISGDVEDILRFGGRRFLASESLYAPQALAELIPAAGEQIPYEVRGEARVAEGMYDTVLRWRHVQPIAAILSATIDAREAAA